MSAKEIKIRRLIRQLTDKRSFKVCICLTYFAMILMAWSGNVLSYIYYRDATNVAIILFVFAIVVKSTQNEVAFLKVKHEH